jgi:hypothetical protein
MLGREATNTNFIIFGLTSVIIQSSNINLKKIILKFFVLSIALAWNGNHFVLLKVTMRKIYNILVEHCMKWTLLSSLKGSNY